MTRVIAKKLVVALAAVLVWSIGSQAMAQNAPKGAPTKVTVSLLYLVADVGIFLGIEKGYFAEQGLELQLERTVSAGDVIGLIANNKIDVGSGGVTPGLYNAFRRNLPVQIVAEKASLLPPMEENGALLVRKDLVESGQVKGMADLKTRRIAVINLQSASLNYTVRALKLGGLGKDDVNWVEMPFSQMIPAFENKAIDAAMVYTPFLQLLQYKLKVAAPIQGSDLAETSKGDALNIMMYSPEFAKTDAAKRFMVAHLKAQRDVLRMIEGKGDIKEACAAIAKYVPAMPADCRGIKFSGIDPDGGINMASFERYQKEWLEWSVMKEPADIAAHIDTGFVKHAASVLGPYKRD